MGVPEVARIAQAPLTHSRTAWHGRLRGSEGEAVARLLRSALVVDDDAGLSAGIARFLREQHLRVGTAASAADAIGQLRAKPDLVILDVRLPDGDAFTVLEHARRLAPAPIRIALSGEASPEDAFRLAQYGVRGFLQKPVGLDELWDAIQAAVEEPPDLAPLVQQTVGHLSLKQLTTKVREEAIAQALARARGSRTGAARILKVTRQAVQQMLRTPGRER
jgi:DNA-binding NtrC family response regulator